MFCSGGEFCWGTPFFSVFCSLDRCFVHSLKIALNNVRVRPRVFEEGPALEEGKGGLRSSNQLKHDEELERYMGMCEKLYKEIEAECLHAFQDAHNTGFYVNEYTTKVHALGDKLFEGLRRASQKVVDKETAQQEEEDAPKSKDRERIKNMLMKMVNLMNSNQVKSGSELVFPMLFDHMSFSTHRTWEMNMKRPWAQALSSWEHTHKQSLKELHKRGDESIGYFLPSSEQFEWDPRLKDLVSVLPKGWLVQERRQTQTPNMSSIAAAVEAETGDNNQYVYISPEHQVFPSIRSALKSVTRTKDWEQLANDERTTGLTETLNNEGLQSHESQTSESHGEQRAVTIEFTSNHDDYMHRGLDSLLASLPAYVYNIWVYTAKKMTEKDPRAWHHIDVPFECSSKIAAIKVQRLSIQPRIPQIQGLTISAPDVDPNKAALLKLLLCNS